MSTVQELRQRAQVLRLQAQECERQANTIEEEWAADCRRLRDQWLKSQEATQQFSKYLDPRLFPPGTILC